MSLHFHSPSNYSSREPTASALGSRRSLRSELKTRSKPDHPRLTQTPEKLNPGVPEAGRPNIGTTSHSCPVERLPPTRTSGICPLPPTGRAGICSSLPPRKKVSASAHSDSGCHSGRGRRRCEQAVQGQRLRLKVAPIPQARQRQSRRVKHKLL